MNYIPFICLVLAIAGAYFSRWQYKISPSYCKNLWGIPFISSTVTAGVMVPLNLLFYFYIPIS